MRKIIWILILFVITSGIGFLCLCLVPLEDSKESIYQSMYSDKPEEYKGTTHYLNHVMEGQDKAYCPGCHSFLWRFNIRMLDAERDMAFEKEKAAKEEERKEKAGK